MTTFAIIAPEGNKSLTEAVAKSFPERFFEFSPGQFVVVASDMTSQQVAEKIGAKGEVGRIVVFTTAGQFGWHRKDLWEWLNTRSNA